MVCSFWEDTTYPTWSWFGDVRCWAHGEKILRHPHHVITKSRVGDVSVWPEISGIPDDDHIEGVAMDLCLALVPAAPGRMIPRQWWSNSITIIFNIEMKVHVADDETIFVDCVIPRYITTKCTANPLKSILECMYSNCVKIPLRLDKMSRSYMTVYKGHTTPLSARIGDMFRGISTGNKFTDTHFINSTFQPCFLVTATKSKSLDSIQWHRETLLLLTYLGFTQQIRRNWLVPYISCEECSF